MNIEGFKNRVYITRKSRINASERLLSRERFIQGLNIYYSCILIAISIYGLRSQSYWISLAGTVASISLTMLLLHLNNQRYSERSEAFKENYIKLQQLYFDIEKSPEDLESIQKLESKYIELLQTSENHTQRDYIKALIYTKEAKWNNYIWYYSLMAAIYILKFLCIIIPIVLFVGAIIYSL